MDKISIIQRILKIQEKFFDTIQLMLLVSTMLKRR
jgi:hypothetical protein